MKFWGWKIMLIKNKRVNMTEAGYSIGRLITSWQLAEMGPQS